MKISLSSLPKHLPRIGTFICCASFESRSVAIGNAISSKVDRAIICINEDYADTAAASIGSLTNVFAGKHTIVNIRTDNPVLIADRLLQLLHHPLLEGDVLVDITTFTHEQLLILMRLLHRTPSTKMFFGYTGAVEYALGLPDEQKWLSRGVDNVRSVLGYPGNLVPSKKLHLIVLAGFESERAEKLMEAYEPTVMSLGMGDQLASISEKHFATNAVFHAKALKFAGEIATVTSTIRQFKFSCSDPFEACQNILHQVQCVPGHNTVVAPMNTKVSTLGCALAALEDESLQLSYAHPMMYNTENYSSPSDECRIFDLTERLRSH